MQTTLLLLQAAGAAAWLPQVLLWGGILLVFYFFMLRPQQKKQKEAQQFIDTLKKGDKVVTIGGAHGTIVSIGEKTVTVEVDSSKGFRIVFEKTSISKDFSSRLTAE
jgi:preprotein translocase subunit YajC